MPPIPSVNDVVDAIAVDWVIRGNYGHSITVGGSSANLAHVGSGEPGGTICFAAKRAYGLALLADHVGDVVFLCAEFQMLGAHAASVVAAVTHDQLAR